MNKSNNSDHSKTCTLDPRGFFVAGFTKALVCGLCNRVLRGGFSYGCIVDRSQLVKTAGGERRKRIHCILTDPVPLFLPTGGGGGGGGIRGGRGGDRDRKAERCLERKEAAAKAEEEEERYSRLRTCAPSLAQ